MRPMHMRRLALPLLLVLAGCGGQDGTAQTLPPVQAETSSAPSPSPPDGSRDRWRSAGSDDYSFTLRLQCYCPTFGDQRVTVVDDQVMRVEALGGDGSRPLERFELTIDDLFNLIEQPDDAASVRAEYDSEYGYPTEIEVDPEANSIDDEYTYFVSDYTPA